MAELPGGDSIEARIGGGSYAAKQLHSKSRVVAWSHGARFKLARKLVTPHAGKRLLDYGCGDGTFIAMVSDLFPDAQGADVSPEQTADCVARLGSIAQLRFRLISELSAARFNQQFDVITCMETMEHCVDENLRVALSDLQRLLAPGGQIIISVPIEIGPTLLLKQVIRRIAGWRRIGQYQYAERYSWRELWKMFWAGQRTQIVREPYAMSFPDLASPFCLGHKGFNWKLLKSEIASRFQIGRILFSPLNWSRGMLSSQVWFICSAGDNLASVT